jgi:glycosyltransferase involved in cell wall biosynthesis
MASGTHNLQTESVAGETTVATVPAEFEVTVVIPCLNEARSIAICIDKARASFSTTNVRGEVIVADNGSTDGSIEIAEQHGARVIRVPTKGYGNALRAGIEAAHGDFIVMGDADDSYDFAQVPEFVAKWRDGADFVMGNRFAGGIKPGAMPWHSAIKSPSCSR